MSSTHIVLIFSFWVLPLKVLAETYEVTASALTDNAGATESTINAQEINTYQETFLKDSLPYSPSVQINTSGPEGRQVDFSIRGARSSQNLMMFNGIYVNDPASGGTSVLADFLNSDFEKIEVLPGPQNLAYGPGALGGVIQLVPKKGKGMPSAKVRGEGGSFETLYGTMSVQGEKGPLQFSTIFSGFGRGPDSFTNRVHGNRQSDRYRNETISSRVGYAVTDNWEVEGVIRYSVGKVQFDNPRFIPEKDITLPFKAPNFSDGETLLTSLESMWGDESVDHSLKLTYSRLLRQTTTPSYKNRTVGEHPFLTYKSDIRLTACSALTAGIDGGQERAKAKNLHKRNHGGIYLIPSYKPFNSTEFRAGVRGDHYESDKTRLTYTVGADQKVMPSTVIRTAYGTNYKPAVLADLFQRTPWQVPNPKLKPETSQNVEAGLDQFFYHKKVKMSLTAYMTWIKKVTLSRQLTGGKWQRFNGGRRKTRGLELALSVKPLSCLEVKTVFSFIHSRDNPGHRKSPLIPKFKGAGGLHWQSTEKFSFFVQGYGVSSQKDAVSKKSISSYGVLHVGGAYDITPYASLFGRIENITNKHYEEVFGYGNRGRAFYIGIEAKA